MFSPAVINSLLPLPLSSRLTSNMGSTVVVTFPQRSQRTSLCSWPANAEWMIQLHDTFVDPRDVEWIWFSAKMKNSCASCCAYPDSSAFDTRQLVARKDVGPCGPV